MHYSDFLKTDEWLDFRDFIWERHGGRCHICGAPGKDVHHLFYQFVHKWSFTAFLTLTIPFDH